MPTVDVTHEIGESTWHRPNVLQVSNLDPADGDSNIPPGYAITFDLKNSSTPHIFNFEDSVDPFYHCTYAEGFTQSLWNTGSGDEWDLYDDDDNTVLRCQGQGFAMMQDEDYLSSVTQAGNTDMVCRVKWFTGTTAGLSSRIRWDSYAKATGGPIGTAAEIDSGGLRYVRYVATGSRSVVATSAFTPTDGEWYWIRLQTYGSYNTYGRAKYWQGSREEEPVAWNISSWNLNYHEPRNLTYLGSGVRCHAGTAYFDNYECWGVPHDDYLADLSVDVGGVELTVANGGLIVRPNAAWQTLNSTNTNWTLANDWRVSVRWGRVSQPIQRTIDVDIQWAGESISTTDFDVQDIPTAWPDFDPDTDAVPGDPNRMGSFESVDGAVVPVGAFSWFATIFPLSLGFQDLGYHIGELAWPTNAQDFTLNIVTPYYTPVDGRYYIGHQVWRDHPASVIPAEPIAKEFPASVVPQGDIRAYFPASVVPQAYFRKEFPANVLPSYELWWEGDGSCVVSREVIHELDASTLVFMRRAGSLIHLRVMSETTHDKLLALGFTFSKPITVGHEIGEYDYDDFTINPPWYGSSWLSRVKITIDHNKVDTDLTDFDVLITDANLPAHFWSNVRSDGADIVVTDSTGKVAGKLKRDLFHWDYADERMGLRFKADIDADADTEFYLYYNNSSGAETNDTDTYEATSVYQPMEENPSAAQVNRTPLGYSMSQVVSGPARVEPGKIGYAVDHNGGVYYQGTTTGVNNNLCTLACWVNIPASSPDDGFALQFGYLQNYGNNHRVQIGVGVGGKPICMTWQPSSATTDTVTDPTARSGWTWVLATFDYTGPACKLYVNGSYINQHTNTFAYTTLGKWCTGAGSNPFGAGGWAWHYTDPMDEARIWPRVMGVNEITTRYNNESDPSSFYSITGPESPP